jgi:adenylate kinase
MNPASVLTLLGPPGSGKGTQAARLASVLGVPAISTGEILRSECQSGSSLGKELAAVLSSGQLVSDGLVSEVVARRLQNTDCAAGCILDGYPRTVSQARSLDELLTKLDLPSAIALDFVVSPREVIGRLERRRQCARCGRIFSMDIGNRSPEFCEFDGAPLIKRADDHPGAIRERLRLYKQNARELVRYYRRCAYHRIRADRSPDDVTNQIFSALELNQRTNVPRAHGTLAPRAAY